MKMPPALARRRNYAGPAFLSYGFRPFFLLGACWSALAIVLWLAQYLAGLALPIAIAPQDWHAHEMVYGYVAAVAAGFLLTAIPNWTGRLPVNGATLGLLAALWAAGRAAMAASQLVGAPAAAMVDIAFLATLAAVAMREIIAGKNWRNLRVLAVLGVLIAGNIVFHVETIVVGAAEYGMRIAIAAVVALIMLIGGRVVPSFTRNWLARLNPGRMPSPFTRFDAVSLAVALIALAAWIVAPGHAIAGGLLGIAGLVQAARLARWAGDRTLSDRLVLVLHVAYAFLPLGFLLLCAAAFSPSSIPASAGIHAWMAGGAGLMTLAVMTRATLGHTGRALVASTATQVIYALAFFAALTRIAASFNGGIALVHAAAALWFAAFAGFVLVFGPMLVRARLAQDHAA